MDRAETASGTVGEIYTTRDGAKLADLWPDSEGDVAWQQISPTERVQITAKRVSHSACVWQKAG